VLRSISLDVPAGTTVALVGRTGAGKSTLAGLLARFHDPDSGVIRIDGLDLRTLRLKSLREQISIVPQEAVLFHATVWENIAYGSLDPMPENDLARADLMPRVESAAVAANAHEFISRLPDGYNTIIGERGSTLSGGQRQRIAIARAMIRNAPILILDEPTTGLDAESEHLVLEAIDRVKAGRTTLIIAHRLATIRSAGLIVVLEDGRIIESGTHADLYGDSGRYRDFVDRQFQFDLTPT
jgi:ABC-type multidrug transport system fused ATPase/permease subunit